MAHIVDFEIQGLAGRTDTVKKKLHRHLNIFFGENGCGKTSLLKILESAMSGDAEAMRSVPFESAKVTIFSINYNKLFTRSIDKRTRKRKLTKSKTAKKKKTKESEEIAYIDETARITTLEDKKLAWKTVGLPIRAHNTRWRHKFLSTWRLYQLAPELFSPHMSRHSQRVSEESFDLDYVFAKSLEILWSQFTAELLSKVEKIQGKGLANVLQTILSAKAEGKSKKTLKPELAYERVATFLRRQGYPEALGAVHIFKKKYINSPQLRRVVDDIYSVELWIDEAKDSRNKLQDLISDMFSTNKHVAFEDKGIEIRTKKGKNIGLTSLSSGEKHLMCIFIESLLASENTLLIDEPEISLHIDWQRKVINSISLLNKHVQLIIATHSPEIMAEIPDEHVNRL